MGGEKKQQKNLAERLVFTNNIHNTHKHTNNNGQWFDLGKGLKGSVVKIELEIFLVGKINLSLVLLIIITFLFNFLFNFFFFFFFFFPSLQG